MEQSKSPEKLYYDEKYSFLIADLINDKYQETDNPFRKSSIIPQKFLDSSGLINILPATFDFIYYSTDIDDGYSLVKDQIMPVLEFYKARFDNFSSNQEEVYLELLEQFESPSTKIKFNYYFDNLEVKVTDFTDWVNSEDLNQFKLFLAYVVYDNYERVKYLPKE